MEKTPSAILKKKYKNANFDLNSLRTHKTNRISLYFSTITEIGKTSTVQNKESNSVLVILKEGGILAIFTLEHHKT